MKKNKAFSPEQNTVLIPYKDLASLLDAAARMGEMEKQIKCMEERKQLCRTCIQSF